MKRLFASLVVLGLAACSVQAHFIWILPKKDGRNAQIVFSDTLGPDEPKLLDKIVKTQVYLRRLDNSETPLKWTRGEDALQIFLPGKGTRAVVGICKYGVVQKGKADPFLLNYYAKAIVLGDAGSQQAATPWKRLPLDVVPVKGKFQVLFQGKPLAGAEVAWSRLGQEKADKSTTDKDGLFTVPPGSTPTCGILVKHVVKEPGEQGGKKYKEVRHYMTLVIKLAGGEGEGTKPPSTVKADPEATKLLAEARAARAQWVKFPGFTADAEINIEGKIHKSKVKVEANGKVHFDKMGSEEAEGWARRTLGSIVAHRIDNSASLDTPCAFETETGKGMPGGSLLLKRNDALGRAVKVLSDELHSSYRIRDRQIIVVNRRMKTSRFSITVLENTKNKEGKYLPSTYVVHYWIDPPSTGSSSMPSESGDLAKTDSHAQTWKRVGAFDLPVSACVITASSYRTLSSFVPDFGLSTRKITLSNHSLSK